MWKSVARCLLISLFWLAMHKFHFFLQFIKNTKSLKILIYFTKRKYFNYASVESTLLIRFFEGLFTYTAPMKRTRKSTFKWRHLCMLYDFIIVVLYSASSDILFKYKMMIKILCEQNEKIFFSSGRACVFDMCKRYASLVCLHKTSTTKCFSRCVQLFETQIVVTESILLWTKVSGVQKFTYGYAMRSDITSTWIFRNERFELRYEYKITNKKESVLLCIESENLNRRRCYTFVP